MIRAEEPDSNYKKDQKLASPKFPYAKRLSPLFCPLRQNAAMHETYMS
jgi:hypothetical protein